jgi:hypothetical protein
MKKIIFTMFITVTTLLFIMSCNSMRISTEIIEKNIEISPKTQLIVINFNGNIQVEVWDQPNVNVKVEKKSYFGRKELSKVTVETNVSENILTLKTINLEESVNITTDYLIKVPSNMFVTSIMSENGNISVKQTKGDLFTQTSNGSITLEKIDGWISAITKNGIVKATNTTGINKIQNLNGSIEADIANFPQEGTQITTNNASITLKISHKAGMYLDLATSNGAIDVKGFGDKNASLRNTQYEAKILEGGKTLFVRTDNGNISIVKQ